MTSFCGFRLRRSLLAAVVTQALSTFPVAAQTATGAQSPAEKAEADTKELVSLEEMVVTAQRRAQDIQEVPIAVTALDAAQLNARGIRNVSDMGVVAPNVIVMVGGSTQTSASIAIRGTTNINPGPYWDQPVALYVDGVYIGKSQGNVFDMLNLERVEVLRGPQGTLFGRNTMAGALSLITRPPSGEFSGDASVSFGNYGSKVTKVTVDLPAMGKLKASLGARVEFRDGWVNTTHGSSEPELANRDSKGTFAGLEYDATDNLTFNYRFDYSKADQRAGFFQTIYSDVEQDLGIPGIIVNRGRQTTASIDSPNFEFSKVEGHSLTATWILSDAGTLKYIGAYREMDWNESLDNDGSPIPLAWTANFTEQDQTSHELQYLGSYGRWNWVGGLYYYEDDGFANQPQSFFFGAATYNQNYSYGTHSRAAYAQVDYELTDRLTLTAGLRRTVEEKRLSRFQEIVGVAVTIPEGTAAEADFDGITPTASLDYQLTPNSMVYTRYAEGFLSGGFNGESTTVISATTPFDQETQQTYEIGTKNKLLDGRLTLNAAIFYNRIDDLQQNVFTAEGSASTNVLNVGSSHQQGFELEARLRPMEDITLGLNYGYLRSDFDEFMILGVDEANNRSPTFAPRNTLGVVIDGVMARTSNGVLHATVDYRYTSSFNMYAYPTTQVTPPSQLAANSVISSYTVINGRIAFSDMNWGHDIQGEVELWGNNLTDNEHINLIVDFGPSFGNLRSVNYNDPRTYGVTVTARW